MAVDSLGFGEGLCALPEQLAAAHELAGKIPGSSLPDAARFDREACRFDFANLISGRLSDC